VNAGIRCNFIHELPAGLPWSRQLTAAFVPWAGRWHQPPLGAGEPHHQHSEGACMKLSRRQSLHLAVGAAALPAASRTAWSQTYPVRQVRIIVGFPPVAK